jgi:hypothetical protein
MSSTWRKSTYSQDTGGACVEVGTWRKSTYSGDTGGNCVEVAAVGAVLVRDTTNRDCFTLSVSASAWSRFLGRLR